MTRAALLRVLVGAVVAFLALLVAAPPGRAAWTWPLRGEVITGYRNGDDPYAAGQHRGIDIAGGLGAPVVAATPGTVRFAGTAGVSGLTVSLRTADGRYDTSYLHLSALSVREGDTVAAGDRLGAVGTTGRRSAAAPHLHFGVRDAGTSQAYHDPLGFLPPLATPGLPEPAAPSPRPEAVPNAPLPAPTRQPVARRVPGGARSPRAAPGARRAAPRTAPRGGRLTAPRPALRLSPRSDPRRAARFDPRRAPRSVPGMAPRSVRRAAPHADRRAAPGSRLRHAPLSAGRDPAGAPDAASGLPSRSGAAPLTALREDPRAASHAASGGGSGGTRESRSRSGASGAGSHPAGAGEGAPSNGDRTAPRQPLQVHSGSAGAPGRQQREPREVGASDPGPQGAPGGPDAGWALACLGLLAAATLVGTSGGGRDFARRRGATVRRALRPLLGRG